MNWKQDEVDHGNEFPGDHADDDKRQKQTLGQWTTWNIVTKKIAVVINGKSPDCLKYPV